MKQKVVSSIGGCLLLAFLLLACPIRGQAKQAIIVTDNDNGVKVEYSLIPVQSEDESAETAYNATISFADEDTEGTTEAAEPTELNIKSEVTDTDEKSYTIKEIEGVAYKDSIEKITMEDGITSIYAYALTGYNAEESSLENVQFPSTLEDITSSEGDSFVSWDSPPDSVRVPNWLKKMKPENGVVYAGKVAIYVPQAEDGAAKTEEITFKDGCVKIAHKAMFGNTDVKKVNIPASVKVIAGAAFDGCSNLSEVNFADNAQLEDLDWRAFYDCTALTSIKIPDSVTRIGTETFSGCTKLSVIDISKQSKLAQVEYGAFGYYPYYNMDLKDMWENKVSGTYGIMFPGPRDRQRENAGVPVESIYLPASAIRPYSPKGYEQSASGLFAGCTTLTNVTIGESGDKKAELPFEMFAKCTNLKTVNLGGNVTKIETGAFIECSSLQSIDLNGVEEINAYAFVRDGLTEVTIPESVKSVAAFAFGSCTKLETMTIQGTIGTSYVELLDILGNTNYALRDSYLHTTNVQMYNPVRSNEEFKELYPHQTALKTLHIEADKEGKTVLSGRTQVAAYLPSLETVTLPEGMTSIPDKTFAQCFSLKNINIPTSIETIGDNAFQYDVGIDVDFTRLTNLTSIGRCAFFIGDANGGNGYADTNYTKWFTESIVNGGIKNIILPDSVKTIGESAFFGQRNVKKVVIPEGVKSVGGNAFQMLPSLEELEIYAPLDLVNYSSLHDKFWSNTWRYSESESNKNKLKKITLGEKYSPETGKNGQIANNLFYGQSLEEVDIQMNNIQNIGYNMFMNNKNLQSFTIPKTVKTIDRAAFYGTTSLKEMKIRKNVKTMDVEAFRKSGLEKVYIFNKDLIIKEPTRENVSEEEQATKTQITLSSDDETVEDYIAIPKNVTIYGYAGSTAEAYAQKYGNTFVDISGDSYKVTFDTAGGSNVTEQQIKAGETASEPEAPTKAHYVFKGWYTDQDYKKAFDFATEIDSNITLYAKWEKAVYTVSFDSAGGSAVAEQQVTYEEKASEPAEPGREHYVFKGWYTDQDYKTAFNFATEIDSNITLYAKWEKEVYTVSFDSAEGSAVAEQKVAYQNKAEEPEAPAKAHYVFKGWYTDEDYKKAFDFDTEIDSDITLYAKWEKEVYTVSFDSAGGSAVAEQQVTYEEKASEPAAPGRDHYVFKGWYTSQDYKTAFDFSTKIDSNITLYAKWEKAVYTVSFDSAGGSAVEEQKVAYQDKAEEPEAPAKAHYVFGGWYTDQDYKKAFDFATKIDSNITLYAKWEKEVYTVSFDSAGGSAVAEQQVTYEETASEPAAPGREHYVFKGWYTAQDYKTAFDFATEIDRNITLYAKWEKEVYTVSFDSAGGSAVEEQKVAYQDKAEEPEAPAKDHYVFKGWYTNQDYKKAFDFATEIDSNITLYAKWEKAVYTVSFDSNGGSAVAGQKVAYQDKAEEPKAPAKAHYVFGGWYTAQDYKTAFNFATEIDSNITLYAKWEKEVYTVSFNSNGGSTVAAQKIAYTGKVTKPSDPKRANYVFKGWYTDKGCTVAFNFEKDLVQNNTLLYAKWEKAQPAVDNTVKKNTLVNSGKYTYKVTDVAKDQTGTVEFTGNVKGKKTATVTIPSTVTIKGKKFKVTSVAPKAFQKNKAVKKVVIGNNVKTIGTKAFYGMKNLQTVVIGKNVTTIKSKAFGNLPKLKKVTVKSKKLKKVHKKAFKPVKHKFTIKVPKAKKTKYKKIMKTYKNLIR